MTITTTQAKIETSYYENMHVTATAGNVVHWFGEIWMTTLESSTIHLDHCSLYVSYLICCSSGYGQILPLLQFDDIYYKN